MSCMIRLYIIKVFIHLIKISYWRNDENVIGVSYGLYGKLDGNTKNKNIQKIENVLIDNV